MFRADILVALCLVASVLPWTLVEGKGCWAGPSPPGRECLYGTFPGSHEMQIRYNFISRFSRICCQAYECKWWGCDFVDLGCGKSTDSIPFQSRPLVWEIKYVEPIMRCYDRPGSGVYYSYTVEPYVNG